MLWTLIHILLIAAIVFAFLSLLYLFGLLAAAAMSCRSGEDAGPYLDATGPVAAGFNLRLPPSSVESVAAGLTLRCECAWCKTVLCPGSPGADITTTICPQCIRRYYPIHNHQPTRA